jgi:hypothetical protein
MNEITNEGVNRQKAIYKPSPRMDNMFKLNSITNKFISFSKERKQHEYKYDRDVSNNSNNTNVGGNTTHNNVTDKSKDIKKSIDASKSKISESLKKNKPVLFKSFSKNLNSSKVPLKIANISNTGAIRNDI